MPIAWVVVPYRRRATAPNPTRYCAMDDYTTLIAADGGAWTEAECLGNHAIVKVRASVVTLTAIATAEPTFHRIPVDTIHTTRLSNLTSAQRSALLNKATALGYSQSELNAQLGTGQTLLNRTLADVLRFLLRRRLKPRYDASADTIVCDGTTQPCIGLDIVDATVT